jgi:hypothetical protein
MGKCAGKVGMIGYPTADPGQQRIQSIPRTIMVVKSHIIKSLRFLLRKRDYLLVKAVDSARLQGFMSRLRPVRTDHDLIRLGSADDGGYLIPDDLENIEHCFSPGVAQIAEFELALTKRGIKCFLADYSVDQPPVQTELIEFEKKHLGIVENQTRMTLDGWVKRKAPGTGDLILQMDIEGDEYEVIFATSQETLKRFRIMLIEFHGLHNIIEPHFFKLAGLAFTKLLQEFAVVHMHPNNDRAPHTYHNLQIPPIIEFTFLRKDRVQNTKPCTSFPHPLDAKNVIGNPEYPLPECWYLE